MTIYRIVRRGWRWEVRGFHRYHSYTIATFWRKKTAGAVADRLNIFHTSYDSTKAEEDIYGRVLPQRKA